jgi:hypothetical protein
MESNLQEPFELIELLTSVVKPMIYGAGDVPQPASDTVALMDDLIIDYITEMVGLFASPFSQLKCFINSFHSFAVLEGCKSRRQARKSKG